MITEDFARIAVTQSLVGTPYLFLLGLGRTSGTGKRTSQTIKPSVNIRTASSNLIIRPTQISQVQKEASRSNAEHTGTMPTEQMVLSCRNGEWRLHVEDMSDEADYQCVLWIDGSPIRAGWEHVSPINIRDIEICMPFVRGPAIIEPGLFWKRVRNTLNSTSLDSLAASRHTAASLLGFARQTRAYLTIGTRASLQPGWTFFDARSWLADADLWALGLCSENKEDVIRAAINLSMNAINHREVVRPADILQEVQRLISIHGRTKRSKIRNRAGSDLF